jgi:hypothetical protein
MIDICTVVFDAELDVLKLQARSIELYCQHIGLKNIFVMVNDLSRVDPAWYGSFADHVRVVPRSDFDCEWSDNGWVSQQVLKLLGAAQSNNAWCMIVDAKTLFVRPVDLDQMIVDGRAATGNMPIYPVFDASRTITNRLFGIDLPAQLGPGGVPFFVEPRMVRDMIEEVERRTGQLFGNYFQQQGMLTEFILYSGYVWYRDQSFSKRYHPQSNIYPCNLCHSETGIFDSKFRTMNHPDTLTISIHRNAWSKLSKEQQQQYHTLLSKRGIL